MPMTKILSTLMMTAVVAVCFSTGAVAGTPERSTESAADGSAATQIRMTFGRRTSGETVNPDWAPLVGSRLTRLVAVIAPSPASGERLAVVLREVIANVRTTRMASRERLAVSLRFSLMAHARTEALTASPRYSFDTRSGAMTLLDADAGEPAATVVDGYDLVERIAAATVCAEARCVDRVLAGGSAASGPA